MSTKTDADDNKTKTITKPRSETQNVLGLGQGVGNGLEKLMDTLHNDLTEAKKRADAAWKEACKDEDPDDPHDRTFIRIKVHQVLEHIQMLQEFVERHAESAKRTRGVEAACPDYKMLLRKRAKRD